MQDISTIGFIGAFIGGFIAFMSPCTLPLIPGYLSSIGAQNRDGQSRGGQNGSAQPNKRSVSMTLSVFFVLGFSSVFILLGLSATALGSFVMAYRFEVNLLGGILIITFGAFMSGLIKMQCATRPQSKCSLTGRDSGWCLSVRVSIRFWLDTLYRANLSSHIKPTAP
ncbi:MAG: cytochrome c biogenesis protein CcdA [Oceanospirillaceae bacterium]